MHQEFVALRARVDALAAEVNGQAGLLSELLAGQATLGEAARSSAADLAVSLAELEGYAAELRNETARLAGLQDATAQQLPDLVAKAVAQEMRSAGRTAAAGPADRAAGASSAAGMRSAVADLAGSVAELRTEAARLRAWRSAVAGELPGLVRDAVADGLPDLVHSVVADALAERDDATSSDPMVRSTLVGPVALRSTGRIGPTEVAAPEPADGQDALPFDAGPEPVGTSGPAAEASDAPTPTPTPAEEGGVPPPPETVDNDELPAPDLAETSDMVVGPGVAAAIGMSLDLARLRRRRRRRAAIPAPGLARRYPFVTPTLRALEMLDETSVDERVARLGRTQPGELVRPLTTIVAGTGRGRELSVDLGRWSRLTLAGPGAADVARSLLTTFLASGSTATATALVVAGRLADIPAFAGLEQSGSPAAALDELAEEVARREQAPAGRGGAGRPTILVIADHLSSSELPRLRSLLRRSRGRGVAGLLVDTTAAVGRDVGEPAGDEGEGAVEVDADGRVVAAAPAALAAELDGGRLYRLGPAPAAELLTVVAAGRTDADHLRASVAVDDGFEPPAAGPDAVVVRMLGRLRVEIHGEEVRHGLREKGRELLAYALVRPEGMDRDRVLDDLWPGIDPERAAELFDAALDNVRSRLAAATGVRELAVLQAEAQGRRLRLEPVFDVDLWRLQRSLHSAVGAAQMGGGTSTRLASFEQVARAYTGDLLAGADWLWARAPREDLRQRIVDVLVWLGDSRWAAGDTAAAAETLNRAIEVDPFAEQLYRRMMRLHARRSSRGELESTYRALEAQLATVGLEPSPESNKLRFEL